MSVLEYSESNVRRWNFIPRGVYNCKNKNCRYVTKSIFYMVNHLRRHWSLQVPFNCEDVSLETYNCKDCNFQTYLTITMKKHIREHHIAKPKELDSLKVQTYSCKNCQFETNSALTWLQHDCCDDANRTNDFYTCRICAFKAKSSNVLIRHVCYKHPTERIMKWHEFFKTVDLLPPGSKRPAKRETYKCKYCSFVSKTKQIVVKHEVTHTPVLFDCDRCSFTSQWKSGVDRHKRSAHVEQGAGPWLQCKNCPYKCKTMGILKQHNVSKHSNWKQFKCDR